MARTRRITRSSICAIELTNITPDETVHQRALVLKGRVSLPLAHPHAPLSHVSIKTTSQSEFPMATFPEQTWPVHSGHFTALVLLPPGAHNLHLDWQDDHYSSSLTLPVTYVPLLQTPPLHLAILVASKSPLLMDCPPHKAAGLSTAHASLDAAVAKLRMAAYMCQAATAEDMRQQGLDRRSFRLEETWATDTVSSAFLPAAHDSESTEADSPHRATAQVHIIRTDRTVAQLRSPKADLHTIFRTALHNHGGPFAPDMPNVVVAGLVLDSHYSPAHSRVLADPSLITVDTSTSLALAALPSHTCWSWPRFLEEVPSTLLDPKPSLGPSSPPSSHTCATGQSALLPALSTAFSCPSIPPDLTPDIATSSRTWTSAFLTDPARAAQPHLYSRRHAHHPLWHPRHALALRCRPHFRLPSDFPNIITHCQALPGAPTITSTFAAGISSKTPPFIATGRLGLRISAPPASLAWIELQGHRQHSPSVERPGESVEYAVDWLEAKFGREEPLEVRAVAMNGEEAVVEDVWALLKGSEWLPLPGWFGGVLRKQSVKSGVVEAGDEDHEYWEWAALLKERGVDGKVTDAVAFDMRVGCILDGGVLYYADGHKAHLGPRIDQHGSEHCFGGGASEKINLSPGVDIVKIEINRDDYGLNGMRTTLSDGTVGGELNEGQEGDIVALEPGPGEFIVGFFGRSDWNRGFNGIQEFGIITAPQRMESVPDCVFDVEELKNTYGGLEDVRREFGSRKRARTDDGGGSCA